MTEGWIKLYRSVMDADSTFSRLTAIQKIIAIYIILNANHKDNIWFDSYRSIEVPVSRGQLVTSRKKIKAWFKNDPSVTEQKVRTTLVKLERLGFLTTTTTNYYTLITIINYEVYQVKENETNQEINQEITSRQPADNQQITTNKNDKNVKNDKNINIKREGGVSDKCPDNKEKSKRFSPPSIKEIQEYCIKRKNNVDAETFFDFYESKGWYVGKNKMKDWKAAVRTWEKRDESGKNKRDNEPNKWNIGKEFFTPGTV